MSLFKEPLFDVIQHILKQEGYEAILDSNFYVRVIKKAKFESDFHKKIFEEIFKLNIQTSIYKCLKNPESFDLYSLIEDFFKKYNFEDKQIILDLFYDIYYDPLFSNIKINSIYEIDFITNSNVTTNFKYNDSLYFSIKNNVLTFYTPLDKISISLKFNRFQYLKEIHNINKLDVSNVTDFSKMFANCKSLKTLDLSNWNVSNGTNFSDMFNWCISLKTLDLSNWNVSNGTNFSEMFCYCENLKTLDLSNWNVSNGTNFSYMFYWCKSLKTLDLSSWNVSNGTDFSYMFWDCFNLKTLDLSNWNVKKSAKIEEMFINCTNIKYFKFK